MAMPVERLVQLSSEYFAAAEAERQSKVSRLEKLEEYKSQLGSVDKLGLLASFSFRRCGSWDDHRGQLDYAIDLHFTAEAEEVPVVVRKVGEAAVILSAASDDGTRYVRPSVEVKYEDLKIHRLLQ